MKQPSVRILIVSCVVIGLLSIGLAVSARDVSAMRHPNLAAAQTFIEKASNKMSAAQVANEFDMNGHATKAKAFLAQAYAEIKLGVEAANKPKR
jgi:hypothetical protein